MVLLLNLLKLFLVVHLCHLLNYQSQYCFFTPADAVEEPMNKFLQSATNTS